MLISTRPFLVIYVVWHPHFAEGSSLARTLYSHYRRELYENVAGGTGLSVIYRSVPATGMAVPMDINFDDSETSAIVLLLDKNWAGDPAWVTWAHQLMDRADAAGLSVRVFPVAIDTEAIRIGFTEQLVRWDRWGKKSEDNRERALISTLTYQFCRMLRSYLAQLKHPTADQDALHQYLSKVEIFLSHSKHDANGKRIAKLIRDRLYQTEGDSLTSFFDVYDIPAGLRFNKVILEKVKVSAVIAIHSDSYSSREWCRREIIEAKRWNVPLVIANCISDVDERSFPYLGNVPVVRLNLRGSSRIDYVVSRLLDEVLKDFLWRCRTHLVMSLAGPEVAFLPRPPELISLAGIADLSKATLVYPDPPLGAEEQLLFDTIVPGVRLRSMTEWLAETTA